MNKVLVLIIEDEPSILNNISIILKISGFECLKASSGSEAFLILETQQPNLILCDVMMPEMDGFEVLKKIRENEKTKELPFCFLSARADVVDINFGLFNGANGYITKPFSAKDLVDTVKKLLPSI